MLCNIFPSCALLILQESFLTVHDQTYCKIFIRLCPLCKLFQIVPTVDSRGTNTSHAAAIIVINLFYHAKSAEVKGQLLAVTCAKKLLKGQRLTVRGQRKSVSALVDVSEYHRRQLIVKLRCSMIEDSLGIMSNWHLRGNLQQDIEIVSNLDEIETFLGMTLF